MFGEEAVREALNSVRQSGQPADVIRARCEHRRLSRWKVPISEGQPTGPASVPLTRRSLLHLRSRHFRGPSHWDAPGRSRTMSSEARGRHSRWEEAGDCSERVSGVCGEVERR